MHPSLKRDPAHSSSHPQCQPKANSTKTEKRTTVASHFVCGEEHMYSTRQAKELRGTMWVTQWRRTPVTSRNPLLQHFHSGGLVFYFQTRGKELECRGSFLFSVQSIIAPSVTGFRVGNLQTATNEFYTQSKSSSASPPERAPCAHTRVECLQHSHTKALIEKKAPKLSSQAAHRQPDFKGHFVLFPQPTVFASIP